MLVATPCQVIVAGFIELISWQARHCWPDTTEWPATDRLGEPVILKPPTTKLDAWQAPPHAALAIGKCVASCVTSDGTPNQAAPVAWQLAHVTEVTAACPAAASDGVVPILKPPTTMLVAWQALQPPVPSAM